MPRTRRSRRRRRRWGHPRAAGPELLAACRPLGGCPTGRAKVTPGFWPFLPGGSSTPSARCWHGGARASRTCWPPATSSPWLGPTRSAAPSVAFPAISTGVYGYPRRPAAADRGRHRRARRPRRDRHLRRLRRRLPPRHPPARRRAGRILDRLMSGRPDCCQHGPRRLALGSPSDWRSTVPPGATGAEVDRGRSPQPGPAPPVADRAPPTSRPGPATCVRSRQSRHHGFLLRTRDDRRGGRHRQRQRHHPWAASGRPTSATTPSPATRARV